MLKIMYNFNAKILNINTPQEEFFTIFKDNNPLKNISFPLVFKKKVNNHPTSLE